MTETRLALLSLMVSGACVFAPPTVRIGHGLLVMIGCWLVAWSMTNRP